MRIRLLPLIALAVGPLAAAEGQTVIDIPDPSEPVGARPYEMVWAHRTEPAPPTVRFDALRGWTLAVSGGAEAELRVSRAQNVWDRPVARLRYRGDGKPGSQPSILIVPPQPIPLPVSRTVRGDASAPPDCVEMWVYGNRWDWENPPDTPPISIAVRLRDADGALRVVSVDRVRWKEWWLLHRKLPADLKPPARLEAFEITGGRQADWREIFLDSARFYREWLPPLRFAARPRRNVKLFPGQDAGANTGPGVLPFPTRPDETILPPQLAGAFINAVARDGSEFRFTYAGKDCRIAYRFAPEQGLAGITAEVNGAPVGRLMDGGGVKTEGASSPPALLSARSDGRTAIAKYADGTALYLMPRQKSLVVDIINRTRGATEVAFGQVSGATAPRTIYVPPITYGGSNPTVLLSRAGARWVYTSIWPDWYQSNGSELYGAEYAGGSAARINGGVRYHPRTDGARNPLYERVFLTVSPRFEEALPVVPNPVGLHAAQAGDRLWQESWGPDDYAKQMKRSGMLRAYGIEKLIQCNHEISWRDGGESFTLRTRAAPKKGGDEALRRYVAHQRSLGWMSGLYTNYTDFAPVNAHWTPDRVQRESSGEWRSAWPRNWALKPLAAVELDAQLAPIIQRKFGSNSAYTDVHTAVAPWGYNDYDARVPGAGTSAQTFYAYGELLRNDSRVYGGPIFSEGTYQWLYAGLADGNYGLTYNGHKLATDPLLPVFDLREIHTRECDIGVSWTSFFCDPIPNWNAPQNIDRSIDRFLLATLAYGHIGWLVEEEHGIARTCRSYYMLQQVQSRYVLKPPVRIAYWNGERLLPVSEAMVDDLPRTRRQLYVAYPGGLELWLNDHPTEEWIVHPGGKRLVLPPAGWAARQPAGRDGGLFSYSGGSGTAKQDYLRSDAYTYLDGRGRWLDTPEAAFSGSLAIRPSSPNRLQVIRISGEGPFLLRRPYGVTGAVAGLSAFDVEGKRLASPSFHDSGRQTRIDPVAGAIRYEVRFSGRRDWSVTPAASEAASGSSVALLVSGRRPDSWEAAGSQVRDGRLFIPEDAPFGSWITARARSGRDVREASVRVCPPVEWSWRVTQFDGAAFLGFPLTWHLGESDRRPAALVATASEGWSENPARVAFTAVSTSEVGFPLYSSAPAGAEGRLEVRIEGIPRAPTARFRLKRVLQNWVARDLREQSFTWGIARRGGPEMPEPGGSGAVCARDDGLTVGGVTKQGFFMHPPYNGGVGYTWAELGPVDVPPIPSRFEALVGLKDGGDPSDGVLFRVELIDAAGARHVLGETLGVQREWRPLRADLSPWNGRRVRLRLIADVGPNDNSVADWACWGEPAIRFSEPRVITEITPE